MLSEVTNVKLDVANVKSDVTDVKSEITDVKSDVVNNKERMNEFTKQIGTIKKELRNKGQENFTIHQGNYYRKYDNKILPLLFPLYLPTIWVKIANL